VKLEPAAAASPALVAMPVAAASALVAAASTTNGVAVPAAAAAGAAAAPVGLPAAAPALAAPQADGAFMYASKARRLPGAAGLCCCAVPNGTESVVNLDASTGSSRSGLACAGPCSKQGGRSKRPGRPAGPDGTLCRAGTWRRRVGFDGLWV